MHVHQWGTARANWVDKEAGRSWSNGGANAADVMALQTGSRLPFFFPPVRSVFTSFIRFGFTHVIQFCTFL